MPNSFFEKLKRGMGANMEIKTDYNPPATLRGEKEEKKEEKKPKEFKIKTKPIEIKVEKIKQPEVSGGKVKTEKKEWFKPEGQLAIDVYQNENYLIIQSAIAGVKPEDLDILIENDILTIRGSRERPSEEGPIKGRSPDYFTKECYWGPFSREVILPVEVDPSRVEATMKEGILTIKIPKIEREKKRKITVKS